MKFGIDFFPSHPSFSGQAYYESALNLAQLSEELGYDFVKMVEHYFIDWGGYCPDPSVFLAAVAARTKKIKLMTGAVLPVFNHPLKLAGQLAMVDCISNGRLIVGVARAFVPMEFDAFGISMDESRDRFEEGVDALIRLWTEENVTFEGKFHQFRNVTNKPNVVQRPHPPIYTASVSTRRSFERSGERGFGQMGVAYFAKFDELADNLNAYRRAFEENGHGKATGDHVILSLHIYLHEDGNTARKEAEPYLASYIGQFKNGVSSWNNRTSSDYEGYTNMGKKADEMTYDRILAETRAIIGTPEEAVEQIRYLKSVFGDFTPLLIPHFGDMKEDVARRSIELFAKHAMPLLRAE